MLHTTALYIYKEIVFLTMNHLPELVFGKVLLLSQNNIVNTRRNVFPKNPIFIV